MPWTRFMDMSSGGGRKESFHHLYIEAPIDEAKVIFFNRFGHNPERVSCTCCGQDYSIDSHDDLAQLTGFDRGCDCIETPRDPKTGLYKNDDPVVVAKYYYEPGETPPEGYSLSGRAWRDEYKTVEQYLASDGVAVIRGDDIKPEERAGFIPEQGYVWVE